MPEHQTNPPVEDHPGKKIACEPIDLLDPVTRRLLGEAVGLQEKKLTPRQKRFCDEYVVDLNGSQAAIRSGYSARSAAAIATENLLKPDIRRRIRQMLAAKRMQSRVTADRIVQELAQLSFDRDGQNAGCRLRAMDMLAKIIGLYDQPWMPDALSARQQQALDEGKQSFEIDDFLQEIFRNLPKEEQKRLSDRLTYAVLRHATSLGVYNMIQETKRRAEAQKAKDTPETERMIEPAKVVDEVFSFTDLEEAAERAKERPDPLEHNLYTWGPDGQPVPTR